MAFWCFLYVYQRVAGFFPDFPHTVPGRRTSKGGFCAAQRLQSLRWGKFTLPQAGHSQFPFSPSDQTRYPIRSIPGCWLDWKGLTRHGSRDPIEKSEIANRSSIQSFLKIQPPPQKKKKLISFYDDSLRWKFPPATGAFLLSPGQRQMASAKVSGSAGIHKAELVGGNHL